MKTVKLSSTSVYPDLEIAQVYHVNVGANMTVGFPSNASTGDRLMFRFMQGDDHVLSFSGNYEFDGGSPPVLGTTGGDVLFLEFVISDSKAWEVTRVVKSA